MDVYGRTATGVRGGGTWGVGVVVAPDLQAVALGCKEAFPAAHVHVAASAVPHVVVRIPLVARGEWPRARAALERLASTSEWLVVTVGPRGDWDDVEERRARAQRLLPLAVTLPTQRRLIDVDELLVFQLLVASEPAVQAGLVQDVLGPVLTHPSGGDRLLATLEALHWNEGSPKRAARKLGVHVKTVHGRLRRIEQLTGLCLDYPPDRMRLDVALYLFRAADAGVATDR